MKNFRNRNGNFTLKLDMFKAYDRVEWRFLEKVLLKIGFDIGWVGRVMLFVSSLGVGPKVMVKNSICGVRVSNRAPMLSHLLYADDSIIFARTRSEEAREIKRILTVYERASGQTISFDKTTICFSKSVGAAKRTELAAFFGVRFVEYQDRYLSLPTVIGRSKRGVTEIIREKLEKKLQGWRGSLLSRAGRDVLIKAVAQSIPTYSISVFKIPSSFCDDIRCLSYRVIAGKYFPNSSFIESSLGSNPSYTWRSIWKAKSVVLQGARWRIGDRHKVKIWTDPWILNTQKGRVLSAKPEGCNLEWVSDLMAEGGCMWDANKVRNFFLPFEVEHILKIKLSSRNVEDIWFWEMEKDGF
ncbi:hypothetical protein RND81_06G023600 [Saponaria officinalis]|uniref:Reverse transcriptase n=1 Tax=Saponaria officinalis TaxID=3572 RepID=A0AAW1K5H7_SAPOF